MIDHIFGRPSPSWKRTQVRVRCDHYALNLRYILTPGHQALFVLTFWIWRLLYGREIPPRLFWLREMNRALGLRMNVLVPELRMADPLRTVRFSPWQIIVGTLTTMYASRNLDKLLGLGGRHASYLLLLSGFIRAHLRFVPVAVRRSSPRTPSWSRERDFPNHGPRTRR